MPENSIIAELKKRAQNKDNQTVEHQLCELLGDIIQFSTHHLTRVREFFPEYDDHSVSHSVQVLEYMANLIGKKRLPKLSVYDLFFLAAAAYVHDWGMAPTDCEKNVLLLAEKLPLPANIPTVSDCKAIINRNEETVFANKKGDALSLSILPNKEEALIKYLAQLYHDYLDFRNGYTEDYCKLSNEPDEEKKDKIDAFNQSVRVDYLRQTHAQRSSDYIRNWPLPKEPLHSRDLFTALASVVSAHVEPFATVDALDSSMPFPLVDDQDDSNVVNLQFCAMLLRIGDILHFSYDRAQAVIRKEIIFTSAYSEKQWQVKKNATVQVTETGVVRFHAFCPTPQQYNYLQSHIGYVNDEIDYFNALAPHWPERYRLPLTHVKNQVKAQNNAFETRPDLKFTLNQNKIIQLLMGVQLYSDPYTCLRELYQNALDACRCVLPMRKQNNPPCTIEFGVKKDDGGRYLYCLDNGKGMSKHIIEHFFLNIGSSYYKSKEFYTQWAKYEASFAPTSQFGIGILSCFMLGTRLEVLTKEYKEENEGNNGLIYFGVVGPQEMFYYWSNERIPDEDKEIFSCRHSGTLVKVYLKKEYADNLECGPLEKMELLKCIETDDDDIVSIEDDKFKNLFNRWQRHIYKHVFDFVQIPFPNIAVQVRVGDQPLPIDPRPSMAKVDWQEYEQDAEVFNKIKVFSYRRKNYESMFWDRNTHSIAYPIVIKRPTYHFHSMLCLPTREDETFEYNRYVSAFTCVDGVQIEGSLSDEFGMEEAMRKVGIFNFVGSQKPPITVDRRKFVNEVPIDDMEALCKRYVREVYRITKKHISKHISSADSSFYNKIWRWVIEQLPKDSLRLLLMNLFDKEVYPSFDIETPFDTLPLPQLMSMKEIILPYHSVSEDREDYIFLIKKLSAVKSYTIAENGDLHLTFADPQTMPLFIRDPDSCSVGLPEDKGLFEDYDIVPPFLPLVSHRLAKADESSVKLDSGAVLFQDSNLNHLIQHLRYKLSGLDDSFLYKKGQTQINSKEIDFFSYRGFFNMPLLLTGYIPEPNADYSNTESGYSFFGRRDNTLIVVKGRMKRFEMAVIYNQLPAKYRF